MRFGTTLLVVFLALLLGGTGGFVYEGATATANVEVSTHGYIAMTLGIVFSLVVGVALMVLVFYSSRYGYDEPARQTKAHDLPPPHETPTAH
jgi:heme/copper-type cytochrome/quinol oxidase subunit 2